MSIKLTLYSHGAGCGCKLSPQVLNQILGDGTHSNFESLLVGNNSKDDAAVYQIDNEMAIISTTDFFMPIVDDPFDFGAIAATNAISDIYAMGGKPMMAIAILGWPIDKLSPEIAKEVVNGGKYICSKAGIPLAGGHSIDSPEPIFGLAVTGSAPVSAIKRNDKAEDGDVMFLTKPLGVGLVTTAQKKGKAEEQDLKVIIESMKTLNDVGETLSHKQGVHAITDVTGFGLAGHLIEVCEASNLSAEVDFTAIPQFPFTQKYLDMDMSPGGTMRNWKSYGNKVAMEEGLDFRLLADPQTSGGLLVAVDPSDANEISELLSQRGLEHNVIGRFVESRDSVVTVI